METTSPAAAQNKKPRRASPKTNTPQPGTSSVTRHERLCTICQHPRREDIDDDILRWRSPQDIVYDFDLGDRSVVYRHGRATKLFSQRKQNLNPALERVIESVYDAKPSMSAILKAMAIYARVNGNEAYKAGFTDPPKHTIITHVRVTDTAAANGLVSAPLYPEPSKDAAHYSDPAQNDTEEQALSPAEENAVRSTTKKSPAGPCADDLGIPQPPASDLLPPECPAGTLKGDVAAPESHFSPIERLRLKYAEVIESRPDIAKALASMSCLILFLASLLWSGLITFNRSSASASAKSSSRILISAPRPNHPVPPYLPLLPLSPVFYPPQNLQSKNANSLKTQPKLISYSPQKHGFSTTSRRDGLQT